MELVIGLTIAILLGFYIAFRPTYNRAPRIIWTYWEEPDHLDPYKRMTEKAKANIEGWRALNPSYKIVILTKKTYHGYVTIPEDMHPELRDTSPYFSSLLKLWTLAEHGGVWLDPNVALMAPLDDWMFPKYAECSVLLSHHTLESWFIACNKKSTFLQKWRDEFSTIRRHPNVEKYVESRTPHAAHPIQVAAEMVLGPYPKESLIRWREDECSRMIRVT